MKNTEYFKDKRVLVVGLARSGKACANLLYDLGARVSVTDNSDSPDTRLNAGRLKSKEIKVELGAHSRDSIKDKDLLVVSPGVSGTAAPILWAGKLNIPVISEIEFAWLLCPAKVIAVTGSNGKTTVTTLIGKIIEKSGKRVFVCGNIGKPFSAEVEKMRQDDLVVLEVSSFQLEYIRNFKPWISVILNFSANHLDRYKDMEEYLTAKKRIFINQDKEDFILLNADIPLIRALSKEAKANALYFSAQGSLNPNQAAALAVGEILGINKEIISGVFREFIGIEHRLEFVAELNRIKFFNDSKCTTADSAAWALKNIPGQVILIAGGRDKGVDYGILLGLARQKVKEVILLGEAKEKIASVFKGQIPVEESDTLENAVGRAYALACPGDNVLLSPMCSSFDMFRDYEERGRVFKKAVLDLKKNGA